MVLRHLERFELSFLLLVLALGGSLWGFVALADNVVEGDLETFDETILLSLRQPEDMGDPIGPRWLEEAVRDITALGSVTVLSLITLATLGFLLLCRLPRVAGFTLVAIAGAEILNQILKRTFARPRPDLVAHGMDVFTHSFPSGHSLMATATFLTLGALVARTHENRWVKVYLLSLALTVSLAVGLSRLYLGVHWPSDVLAGWAAGAGWATLCWLIARWLQRRGTIESEGGRRLEAAR